MTQLRVSTAITDIRASIPHDLVGLTLLLAQHGWTLTITTESRVAPGEGGCVSVTREEWLGMPVCEYRVAYFTRDLQDESFLEGARKLTELCLQLEEVFTDTFPAESVSNDGCVYEDQGRKEASKQGAIALIQYIGKQHTESREDKTPRIHFRFGFMNLVWDAQEIIIKQSDLQQLESFINEKRHRQ